MPIAYKVPKLETLPEAQRALYIPDGNEFRLDVEGVVPEATHAEFRNNNRELMRLVGAKDIAEAKQKLEALKDIDPAAYVKLKADFEALKATNPQDVNKLVEQRTETMRTDYERQTKAAEKTIADLNARLAKVLIDDALATAATAKGVKASAVEDIKLRGRGVFKIENGAVVAFDTDGKTALYGKDGHGLSISEWMDKLATSATHLFEENKGGGGGGGNRGGHNFTEPNPYSTKTMNRTRQAHLEKTNPALAEALKSSAVV